MKPVVTRIALLSCSVLLAFSVGASAQSQSAAPQQNAEPKPVSLGDVARQQRNAAHPKAKRVVTEENITPSEAAAVSQSQADRPPAPTTDDNEKNDKKVVPEDKEKARVKPFIEAVETQKKRIAAAQKKIQDLKSEQRQRASAQYADMGVLLRDPQKWNNDEKAVQEEIAKNQAEIDDANVQLEEARERARKNGVRLPE